jgi:hypothetical protein
MLLAGKAACSGIVFILLTIGVSGPRATPLALGANLPKEVPAVRNRNDVRKMQQTLQNRRTLPRGGRWRLGLRTRASIRGFQKAENLPVTGQLDTQTANKLGVKPEGREEAGDETTKGKPSAGIKSAKGSGRTSKPLWKGSQDSCSPESGRPAPEKTLQAENDKRPQ